MELQERYGWVCPVCGRVNAPFMVCCTCSTPIKTSTNTTGTNLEKEEAMEDMKEWRDKMLWSLFDIKK